ncbi:hypothetical protein M8J76_009808 [Diaphorina citri]|nr:hypothetical protein M8J76_009808 [Diaphorina citri]
MDGKIEKMEVDVPNTLKRSNSVPIINTTMASTSTATNAPPVEREPHIYPPLRNRRYSASFSPIFNPTSPKLLRVHQLQQEEGSDVVNREVAHEKELHNTLQMSLSCEDLTVGDKLDGDMNGTKLKTKVFDPLHLNLPNNCPPLCSTPSPTPLPRCFSPSVVSSPSPTRKFSLRRSLSPILRPSTLGPVKRKLEDDSNEEGRFSKRPSFGLLATQKTDVALSPLATPDSFIHTDSDSSSSNM